MNPEEELFYCTFCDKETGGYDKGAFFFCQGPVRSSSDGTCCSKCCEKMGIQPTCPCNKCGWPAIDPWILDEGEFCASCAQEIELERKTRYNVGWESDDEDDEFGLFRS